MRRKGAGLRPYRAAFFSRPFRNRVLPISVGGGEEFAAPSPLNLAAAR